MTAVEYLINIIDQTDWNNYTTEERLEVFNQSKEMEKQQKGYSEEEVELILNFVDENYYKHGDGWNPYYKDDWITTKQLLEIFKNK